MTVDFPQFKKVTLEDKRFFDEFNAKFPPYADWAFGTLMTWWDIYDDLEACRLGDNIVIKSSYLTMGESPRLTLLGDQDIDEAIDAIFAYQKQHNQPQGVYSLPQYTLDALQAPQNYRINDDLDAAEYIVKSGLIPSIQKEVHHFERMAADSTIDITQLPLDNLQAKMMLINSLHTWQNIYKNDEERIEGRAIDRALLIAEHVDLESLCVFIDKRLAGFVLYKSLPQKYANINHIKGSREYPDLFRYLTHVIAQHLERTGYDYLNCEQDIGVEGLRHYKTSLMPVDKFHKYDIYPLTEAGG